MMLVLAALALRHPNQIMINLIERSSFYKNNDNEADR
jgi:hypothetical protein